MNKNFALIGAAGYVAPRHMKAIRDTGNTLVAALDINDSVGIIDSYFPKASYFKEFERFDRHVEKLRFEAHMNRIDYVSICSPNFLHDAHIRFALRSGADAICEKPVVLNPWNIDALQKVEKESGKSVFTILQLRVHPAIIALKKKISQELKEKKHEIDLTYITSRGLWYHYSWKGNLEKSGGIATNIGVHFFDMLYFVFGDIQYVEVHYQSKETVSGYLELENARVRWFLSIDEKNLPQQIAEQGGRTYRALEIDGEEFEFSGGFNDLHTVLYNNILNGIGFSLEDNRAAIETVAKIRNSESIKSKELSHPYLNKVIKK